MRWQHFQGSRYLRVRRGTFQVICTFRKERIPLDPDGFKHLEVAAEIKGSEATIRCRSRDL